MTEYYYVWETTPTTPVCENYTFTGWYKDRECTKKYPPATSYSQEASDFPSILYAGWSCKHKNLIIHEPYPATYDEYGLAEAYWECVACHQLYSDEDGTHEIDEPNFIPKTSITHYGVDENGIKWELYEYGKLCIKGNGAMQDYTSTSEIPWYTQKMSITDIVIENGITHIGSNAFYGCAQAMRIDIAESVLSVGESAFYRCDDIVIYGYTESYAEEYAQLNGFEFVNTRPHIMKDISVDYYYSTKKRYFDVSVSEAEDNTYVFLCIYDGSKQLMYSEPKRCEIGDITYFELPIEQEDKACTYKVFVWQDMLPVTNVYDGDL